MTADSFNWDEELPPETEAEVYRALLRALQRKQGFGLFFVQCTPAQGTKILADLQRDLPRQQIQALHLEGEVTTLSDQIAALWQQQPFDVLVLDGLEASLYAYEDVKRLSGWSSEEVYNYSWKGVPKLLNHLNQQREHLRNEFPARLVFLVPLFVVDYFIQRAPDFLDWRSGLFRFPRDPEEITEDVDRFLGGDYTKFLALSSHQRIERILNLKSLLQDCLDTDLKANLLLELGLLFAAEQDYANAITSWEKAIEFKPNYHLAWYNRGTVLSALGHREEAITSYDKAIEFKPDFHEACLNRGIALDDLGHKEEAIASYDKTIEFKPDSHQAWYNRGIALNNLGRKEEAIASYDKAIEFKPDSHQAWNNRGLALSALGRKEEAIASFDKTIEFKPDSHQTWNNRGLALSALGRKEEAIASFDKAIEFNPNYHLAWFFRGAEFFTLGRIGEAINSFDKVIEINPNFQEAWYIRGLTLAELGRKEEAIASYDKVIELKLDEYQAWDSRGDVLRDTERFEEAIASYDRAIEINPEYHFPWRGRGLALMHLQQLEQAHESFDRTILLKPDDARAHYDKACCYGLQGQVDRAVETLQHAITLDSQYREMAKTDLDFDSIREDDRFQALIGE